MSKKEKKGSIFSRFSFSKPVSPELADEETRLEDESLDALMEEGTEEETVDAPTEEKTDGDEFAEFMASFIESMDEGNGETGSEESEDAPIRDASDKPSGIEIDDELDAILASYAAEMIGESEDGDGDDGKDAEPAEAAQAPTAVENTEAPATAVIVEDTKTPETSETTETSETPTAPKAALDRGEVEGEDEADEDEVEDESAVSDNSQIDEDAATLLAAMGYSESDAGASKARRTRRQASGTTEADLTMAFGYEGQEYATKAQRGEIKDAYARDRIGALVRLGAGALVVILLFIYDTFGKFFGGPLSPEMYPTVNILISLQIILISAAFSIKQVLAGIKGVLKAEPTIHSITATAVIITVIYDIILAIIAPEAFTLYNLPAAVCLLFGALHDFLVIERERAAFDRLASFESVATFERVDSVALAMELGESAIGEEEGRVGVAFRIKKAPFAVNYFRHTNRKMTTLKALNFIIAPVLALSLVIFIVSLAASRTVVESLNVFACINLFSLPVFMLVCMSFPFFTLIKKKLGGDAVILSEAAVNEYADVNTVVLEENDVFDENSLTINRMTVCDKSRMDQIFEIMCGLSALYDKVGGRIAGAVRASTSDSETTPDAKIIAVSDGGIEGEVAGRKYVVGSEKFLVDKGISVMRYYDDKYLASNAGGVVLHIAVDGVEVFKLYLSYRIPDKTFNMIDRLSKFGTRLVMRSEDPNINDELISKLLGEGVSLTLIRKAYEEKSGEDEGAGERNAVNGALIVNGSDIEALIDAVAACKVFRAYSKLNFYVSAALIAIGVLLSAFLGALGALIGMSSLYIVLFQILSALPSVLLAKLLLE
jgi:cation transport ATPase